MYSMYYGNVWTTLSLIKVRYENNTKYVNIRIVYIIQEHASYVVSNN